MIDFPAKPQLTLVMNGKAWPHHFTSVEEEYQALTNRVSLLNFEHLEWIRMRGSDVVSFLQGMVTQNVPGIEINHSQSAFLLDSGGKIVTMIRIFRFEEELFLLQTEPGESQKVYEQLDKYLITEDVEMSLAPDLTCVSFQGPETLRFAQKWGEPGQLWMNHDRCGLGGFDMICPNNAVPTLSLVFAEMGATPTGMAALDQVRMESFLPWYGRDMEPGRNPLIYGVGGRVSFDKGCYVGQETVAKTRDRGRPPQLMVRLRSDGENLPRFNTPLTRDDKEVGVITSAVYSPKYEGPLALGLVSFKLAEAQQQFIDHNGQLWTIDQVSDYRN